MRQHGYAAVPAWPVSAWLDIAYLVVFATIVGVVLFYWGGASLRCGPRLDGEPA